MKDDRDMAEYQRKDGFRGIINAGDTQNSRYVENDPRYHEVNLFHQDLFRKVNNDWKERDLNDQLLNYCGDICEKRVQSEEKPIHRISDTDWQRIRAGLSSPSYHKIVEDLILNSIDANAKSIEIICNVKEFSLEVMDDGSGISLEDLSLIGQSNQSSKVISSASYGFKGETLASISHIAKMKIVSKTREDNRTHGFKVSNGKCEKVPVPPRLTYGTTITVTEIFHNLPVRRIAMKPITEISKIKEFVQSMSILHYSFSWLLVDISSSSSSISSSSLSSKKRKVLLQLPPHPSVSSQLIKLYSIDLFSKLREIHVTVKDFTLQGLISSLHSDDCSDTKNCQFLFINNQWIRGIDIISNLINEYFKTILGQNKFSSISRYFNHHPTKVPCTPNFVLQIVCPHDSYEILSDGDKSTTIFRDERIVYQLIDSMIHSLKDDHSLQMNMDIGTTIHLSAKSSIQRQQSIDKSMNFINPINSTPFININRPTTPFRNFFYIYPDDYDMNTTKYDVHEESRFDVAFMSSMNSQLIDDKDWYTNTDLTPENDKYLHRNIFHHRHEDKSIRVHSVFHESEVYCDRQFPELFQDENESENKSENESESESEESNSINLYQQSLFLEPIQSSQLSPSNKNTTVKDPTSIIKSPFFSKVLSTDKMNSSKYHELDYIDPMTTTLQPSPSCYPSSYVSSLSISRSMLASSTLIGQLDKKFILIKSHDGQVIAIDQHAADERIHLETSIKSMKSQLIIAQVRYFIEIHEINDQYIVENKYNILNSWGFHYHFIPSVETATIHKYIKQKRKKNIDSGTECNLMLTQVPVLCDESLNDHDFMEFIQYLSKNMDIPDALIEPPVVHRILASKSCRRAIKFGTILSNDECNTLMKDLLDTNLPFQCAHGRPSVVPLVHLQSM